jgi:hypothetical protein
MNASEGWGTVISIGASSRKITKINAADDHQSYLFTFAV